VALIDLSRKPTGWQKWLLMAPSYLYRAHLGFLFGRRFLMVEHRGRTSGTLYRTVIEVAGQLTDPPEYVCTSGTGPNADWYRNLQAGGLDAVWVGSKRHRATTRFLEPAEAASVMAEYERRHPKTAARLYEAMGVSYDGTEEGLVEMMDRIPMVAFSVDA
jgi:deazaflavin-dependent oxidoreductase (nitroreductase family)